MMQKDLDVLKKHLGLFQKHFSLFGKHFSLFGVHRNLLRKSISNEPNYDFNIKNLKGVDITKEYANACEKHGIKVGYYFSLLDWNHPDYDPTGSGISYPKGNYEAEKKRRKTFW